MASFGSHQLTQYYICILCFNAMVSRWVGGEGGAGAEVADYPALSVDRAGGGNPLYAGDTPIQEFLNWCAPIQEFLNRCAPIQEFLIWCAGQLEKKHSFCRFLAHFLASSVLFCRQHVCQADIQKKNLS